MSKRDDVLAAVLALVRTALPSAEVKLNMPKPETVPPGGMVILHDGTMAETEVFLSPLTYEYDHRIPMEVAAFPSGVLTAEQAIAQMLTAIGEAIEADRTLAGLVDFLEPEGPAEDDIEVRGAVSGRWADVAVTATYSVEGSPLR